MNDILLGYGVFSIGGVDVALTRGGGQFMVERTYKEILADGDYGPVKGRVRKDASRAKLVIRALEVIADNIPKMYPAMTMTGTTTKTITGATDIVNGDYQTVTFTGKTVSGKDIIITLENALNLENLDWSFVDKDEVVPEVTYTGAYDPNTRTVEPWNIQYIDASLTPPTMYTVAPKAGTATALVLEFSEPLNATTLAITDRFNLLSSITNDSVAVAITTLANSVQWFNTTSQTPSCVITIASTTFVTGKTVRVNAKTSAIKDLPGNAILAATNSDAVVTA
jgi:hypothetical protein